MASGDARPNYSSLRRIAIVNRGEAAMRLIHAVRDSNADFGDGAHIAATADEPLTTKVPLLTVVEPV